MDSQKHYNLGDRQKAPFDRVKAPFERLKAPFQKVAKSWFEQKKSIWVLSWYQITTSNPNSPQLHGFANWIKSVENGFRKTFPEIRWDVQALESSNVANRITKIRWVPGRAGSFLNKEGQVREPINLGSDGQRCGPSNGAADLSPILSGVLSWLSLK